MRHTSLLLVFGLVACGGVGKSNDEKFCDLLVECYPNEFPSVEECLGDETDETEEIPCATEYDALLSCIVSLPDCASLNDYYEEPVEDYPCAAQDDVYMDCLTAS